MSPHQWMTADAVASVREGYSLLRRLALSCFALMFVVIIAGFFLLGTFLYWVLVLAVPGLHAAFYAWLYRLQLNRHEAALREHQAKTASHTPVQPTHLRRTK